MWTAVAVDLGLVAVMSVISYFTYGFDKRRATTSGRRMSERTLLVLAFVGGWPGSLLAQRRFRHKTQKVPFLIAFWFVGVVHVVLVGAVAYKLFGSATD